MGKSTQKHCSYCNKEHLSRDEVALTAKLIPNRAEKPMCLSCLAEYFESTEEEMEDFIERFKSEGCELFD